MEEDESHRSAHEVAGGYLSLSADFGAGSGEDGGGGHARRSLYGRGCSSNAGNRVSIV